MPAELSLLILFKMIWSIDMTVSYLFLLTFWQDFGIEDAQDLLNIYDKIMDKIVNPIKGTIDGFRDIIQMFRDGTMKEIFDSFRDTVRMLPKMLGALTLRVRDFLKDLYSAAGNVVTEELKNTIGHLRQYVDGIKSDVLSFYSVSYNNINNWYDNKIM